MQEERLEDMGKPRSQAEVSIFNQAYARALDKELDLIRQSALGDPTNYERLRQDYARVDYLRRLLNGELKDVGAEAHDKLNSEIDHLTVDQAVLNGQLKLIERSREGMDYEDVTGRQELQGHLLRLHLKLDEIWREIKSKNEELEQLESGLRDPSASIMPRTEDDKTKLN